MAKIKIVSNALFNVLVVLTGIVQLAEGIGKVKSANVPLVTTRMAFQSYVKVKLFC
jgi:hypothetical protein